MPKNENITQLDHKQYTARTFDGDNDAQRVVIVGGEGITIKADVKMPEHNVQIVDIPVIVKQLEVKEIEKPIIIKETVFEKIEIPVISEKIKIVEIEKPIIHTVFQKVEVPVIVKEREPLHKGIKYLLIAQAMCFIIVEIVKLIK